MDQILALIPRDGAWSIVALLFILVFGSQQILSEDGAKKFWVVGRLARRIESRKIRSIENEVELNQTLVRSLREEIRGLRQQMKEEHERSIEAESRLRADLDDAWDYVTWSIGWSRVVRQMAAQHGWAPPLPEWLSPDEWRQRNHRGKKK